MEANAQWAAAAGQFELSDTIEIPLLGVVAAGQPYQAFPLDETLSVPTTLWGGKKVFALRVRGNSMVEDGIHHGDYLIVEPCQVAENGQTVVAEIDGCVTVKKFYRMPDGEVRLQPANAEMLPLIVHGEHVRIIGAVAGVLRKFGFHEKPGLPVPGATRAAESAVSRPHASVSGRAARSVAHDDASLELAVNVIDSQLVRWNSALAQAHKDRRQRDHLPRMEELGRDLQALRDWCARTHKPGLRRALIDEANKVMRRMQRFAAVTPVSMPDLVLH